ncbi:MAG: hypothetical protein JWN98_379, partial [Abditibacteriota bacterium]|nr:hypothetical protein [Abditibacteriota bacterium]
ALIVSLHSDNTSEARVPAGVTIAAGSTSATFPITAVNDGAVDGTQTVVITASSDGLRSGTTALRVTDNDARLTLVITPRTFRETAGTIAATGTVTRNTGTGSNLTVTLVSSDTSEATVPRTVVIPAGSTSATFVVSAVNDELIDGPQNVIISASASGLRPASAQVTVTDDDARLTLAITPRTFSEAAGQFGASGTIIRNTDTTNSLTITLRSSDTTEATVPSSVVIPAGATSLTFPIAAVNDNQRDGDRVSTITATAPGLIGATLNVNVTDDD